MTKERNTLMSKVKYIGLDVHQVSISAAVLDESGKVMLQCTLPTQSSAILEFIAGIRGQRANHLRRRNPFGMAL